MKKTNLIKVLAIVLVMLLILPVVVSAYEAAGEYTITIPEGLVAAEDGSAEFEGEGAMLTIMSQDAEDVAEEDFYTQEVAEAMADSFIANFDESTTGLSDVDFTSGNEEVLEGTFTDNGYNAIKLSFGITGTNDETGDEEEGTIEIYYTLQNGKMYIVIALYEEGNTLTSQAISTLTFIEPAEEQPEEPAEEEDDSKKDGKIAQAGVKVSFEGAAITMLAVCGLLLVVNNKRK